MTYNKTQNVTYIKYIIRFCEFHIQTKGYKIHNTCRCHYMNIFCIYLKGLKYDLIKLEEERGKERSRGESRETGRTVLKTGRLQV